MALTVHDDYWDDVPRFGRAGHRWLRRQLYGHAAKWIRDNRRLNPEDEACQEILARMVRAVAEDWEELITWKDYEEFRGSDFASGEWKLNTEAVAARWRAAFANAGAAEEACRYPTLDAWLAALHHGELGKDGGCLEPFACNLIEKAAQRQFFERRDRLHRTWPRLCTSCGVEFSPGRRCIRRCPECRSQTPRARPERVGAAVLVRLMGERGFSDARALADAAKCGGWGCVERWLKGKQRPGRLSADLVGRCLGLSEPRPLYWAFRDPATWPAELKPAIAALLKKAGTGRTGPGEADTTAAAP